MPTNRRILSQDAAVSAGDANAAQGLVLHLDANDEDSIESGGANQGNGSGTWFDIANHDLVTPLADKASNLQLHLNASDTTSYSGSGSTWTDISGNSRNGTINGGVESTYSADIRGRFDLAENTGDYFEVTHHNDISPSSSGITFEAWVTPDNTSNTNNIFFIGNDSGFGEFSAGTNSATAFITTTTASGVVNNVATGSVITAGQLHHIVFTMSNVTNPVVNIYVDGTFQVTNTGSGTVIDTNANLKIGRYTTGNANDFDGKIHAVRVYNTVLTASEVAQNFRAGNTFSYSSIYSTDLAIHLDAADDTTVSATTWSDKANSNNATIGSSVGFSSTLSDYYDKELGNWLVLDGSDDNMTIASNSSFQNATAFTVEMWIEPISIADNEMLSTLYTSGSDFKWDLRFNSASGDIRWGVANSSGAFASSQDIITTDTLSTGNWHHLVATYDDSANTQKIFFNGIEVKAASSPTAGTRTGGSDDIDIGHRVGSFEANIKIGQYRLYNTSLTAAQVAQNYLATKNDYPNGHNGTLYGPTLDTSGSYNFFDFDGSNDYIDVNYQPSKRNSYSAAMFIRFPDVTPSTNSYFFTNITGSNEINATIHIGLETTGEWIVYVGNESSFQGSSGTATGLSNNVWAHIVFVFDGINDEIKYYKNGSFVSNIITGATFIGAIDANGTLKIGRYGDASVLYTQMDLGQVKVFEKALSASEITALYDLDKATYGLS